jgi:multicomponent Na+:H+ antiporter subunit D
MPFTMGAFTIGALSMIGLPPTAGFISKWYLLSAAWETEYVFVVVVVVLSTLLNAAYFLPIIYRAFFRAPPPPGSAHRADHGAFAEDPEHPLDHPTAADGLFGDEADHSHAHGTGAHGEAPWPMVVALCSTAAVTVAFFFYSDLAIDLATQLRKGLLP